MTAPKATGPGPGRLSRLTSESLTDRTRDALVEAILRGSFDSGRLPAENELAEQLGVSRTTVRAALQSLEQVGMIERTPGRGTRLRKHAGQNVLLLHGLVPFSSLLAEKGHDVTSEVEWSRATTDETTAHRLGCEVNLPIYETRILLSADTEPAVSITERFLTSVLLEPLENIAVPDSLLKLSPEYFTKSIDHAFAQLSPRLADPTTRIASPGSPYILVEETFYSRDDDPLAIADVAVNNAFVQYAVMRRFND
jgi:GntR family transcriptional regulator